MTTETRGRATPSINREKVLIDVLELQRGMMEYVKTRKAEHEFELNRMAWFVLECLVDPTGDHTE